MLYCPFFMAQSTMTLKVQVQAYRIGTCWRWCHDMHERPAFGQEVLEGDMSVTVCVVSMSRHSFEETFKVIYSGELFEREKQNRRHTKQLEATATLNDFRARSAAAMCSLLQQHDRQLRWLLWLVLGVLGLELHIPALNMHIFRTSEKDANTCFCYYTSASCHGITFYYGLVLCSPPLSLFQVIWFQAKTRPEMESMKLWARTSLGLQGGISFGIKLVLRSGFISEDSVITGSCGLGQAAIHQEGQKRRHTNTAVCGQRPASLHYSISTYINNFRIHMLCSQRCCMQSQTCPAQNLLNCWLLCEAEQISLYVFDPPLHSDARSASPTLLLVLPSCLVFLVLQQSSEYLPFSL